MLPRSPLVRRCRGRAANLHSEGGQYLRPQTKMLYFLNILMTPAFDRDGIDTGSVWFYDRAEVGDEGERGSRVRITGALHSGPGVTAKDPQGNGRRLLSAKK